MAPNSPPPLRASAPQPTFAPSPTSAQGNHSRSPPLTAPPRPSDSRARRCNETSSAPQRPTPAEVYANEHHPRRERDPSHLAPTTRTSHQPHHVVPSVKAKPLFDWITRKLGAGRRATYSVGSSSLPSASSSSAPRARNTGRLAKADHRAVTQSGGPLSPTQIFGPAASIRDNANSIARSESHSLRSYSMSYANSVERQLRREANNPYPSMPVPTFHRDSTVDTVSESHFSRSRTPSMQSEMSRPKLSTWDVEGASSIWAGAEADEDASIRPFPPSHPSSPTPSQSLLSRSASASLLSPVAHGLPKPSSFIARPKTHRSMSSSSASSDHEGRQSRQDSTSTKPTTVLSFDSGPHMAHIAQAPSAVSAPPAPSHNMVLPPASPVRQGSASVPTSATPFESTQAQRASGSTSPPFTAPLRSSGSDNSLALAQAPKHSHPHPRDNPHPSSPPEPNASTLTLASSNFAGIPTPVAAPLQPQSPMHASPAATRLRDLTIAGPSNYNPLFRPPSLAASPSVTFAPDTGNDRPSSTYEYAPSLQSYYALSAYGPASIRTGGWSRSSAAADRDASVRAVRRKGSWESNESGWSWKGQLYAQSSGAVTPQAGPGMGPSQGLLYPASHRSSAYGIHDDDTSAAKLTAREGLLTRESFVTAQSRLSRGSRGSKGSQGWSEGQEETPGVENRRFELERVATPIMA